MDGDGHIKDVLELHCRTDEEAIETAEQRRDGRTMELWERARVVMKFDPRQDA